MIMTASHARPVALITLFALAFIATGCMKLERAPLERRYYSLEVQRADAADQPACAMNLKVRRVDVSPLFENRAIVYRASSGEFEADFYNEFFVAPEDILTQNVRQWMQSARLYAQVVDPSSLLRAGHVLEVNVPLLYGDYQADPPAAVVEVQFLLLDERKSDPVVVLAKSYDRTVAVQEASAKSVTAGMEQALTEIFTAFEKDLRATLGDLGAGECAD